MPRKTDATNTNTQILAVLVERMDTFIKASDNRHMELKGELKDIKDNTTERIASNSNKIDRLAMDKADKADFQKLSDTIERRFDEAQKIAETLLLKSAFEKYVEENNRKVEMLIQYKSTVRGIMLTVSVVVPIITPLITYLLLRHFK